MAERLRAAPKRPSSSQLSLKWILAEVECGLALEQASAQHLGGPVARKIWWCDNCGCESHSRGRCSECGEHLLLSPLPELEPGRRDEEVGYGLANWEDRPASGSQRRLLVPALFTASKMKS